MDLLALWGKTGANGAYHPLLCHLLDVAAVVAALAPRAGGCPPLPPDWLLYLTALHDLGKADPHFQNKDPVCAQRVADQGLVLPGETGPFRHEYRTAAWVQHHLIADMGWGQRAARVIAQALHGHHGDFLSPLVRPPASIIADDPEERPRRYAQWEAVRREVAAAVRAVLPVSPWRIDAFPDASVLGLRLSGLLVLADWIASNDELFHYTALAPGEDLSAYYAAAGQEASRALARLGLEAVPPARVTGSPLSFTTLWPACTTLRPLQQALETLCREAPPPHGLAILEAPMGEGKTEAALYLAEHWRQADGRTGAYLALPTAATSNQMHARYRDFLGWWRPGQVAPRLVHGMAWLLDAETPLQIGMSGDPEEDDARALEWFRPAKRALLAPDAVGTIDQALMAALHVKHGFLRLFGLASKVLILDEVHAYDAYMTTILARLLTWCRALEIPVILLSATLSAQQKAQLVAAYTGAEVPAPADGTSPYPLITLAPLDGPVQTLPVPDDPTRHRRVDVRQHPGLLTDPAATAALAARCIQDGGCACVLANTVGEAQAIYRALQGLALPDTTLLLFHARFRAEQRQQIEQQVVRLFGKTATATSDPPRPIRAMLVATQVVEQSLDVDFDVMISQLAPIDLLLQRCGRLHRHARGARPTGPQPVLHVLLPAAGTYELGGTGRVYAQEPLLRTLALLHGRDTIELPAEFRRLVEGCYSETPLPPGVIDPAVLAAAAEERMRARAADAASARLHLIPEPDARVFRLAERTGVVDEGEEGKAADFFHAQTRLGDDSQSVLVLHDPALWAAVQRERPPDRHTLQRLFLQQVTLPGWWLRELQHADGTAADLTGPAWLQQRLVLPMVDGAWHGRWAGRPVTLRDDPALGMIREEYPAGER